MLKILLKRALGRFGQRYEYDVEYMERLIDINPRAFYKLSKVQGISSHRVGIPAEPWFAAKIRTVLAEDCGPCTQLAVNMALEAGVEPDRVTSIVARNLPDLSYETGLVIRFTELVLAHDPEADELRKEIVRLWGEQAVISLAFVISATRIYPTLKYALGYGVACRKISICGNAFAPVRALAVAQ